MIIGIGSDVVDIRRIEKVIGRHGAQLARRLGLEVHAGHGLNFATAEAIAALPEIVELNIGHFLIGEAVSYGLAGAVKTMRTAIDRGRA